MNFQDFKQPRVPLTQWLPPKTRARTRAQHSSVTFLYVRNGTSEVVLGGDLSDRHQQVELVVVEVLGRAGGGRGRAGQAVSAQRLRVWGLNQRGHPLYERVSAAAASLPLSVSAS